MTGKAIEPHGKGIEHYDIAHRKLAPMLGLQIEPRSLTLNDSEDSIFSSLPNPEDPLVLD
ncbi:hypothetical protein RhiJN_02860 [Ceratobasidium sp. AG-Ba]|nr:hypothetical protein RhiJN_02860 [Ceratobasidium sp. AG-Ba]QRW03749.1 hypothetical protein RhiLY_02748 [Ceratobasidium sp. AG-Ba]